MSGRFCIDANGLITSWNVYYRPTVVPSLWQQLSLNKLDILLVQPIFDEIVQISAVDKKLPIEEQRRRFPLRSWLIDHAFTATDLTPDAEVLSLQLEREYETDQYSKGAGQVDINLIAFAKLMSKTVVTYEGRQPEAPGKKSNYKIPLICREQNVECIDFITMLERLQICI